MGRKRKQSYRGPDLSKFANPELKLRGPDGKYLCRVCGTEVKPPKITFCSPACVALWRWETHPKVRRRAVYMRDKGICSCCGEDTRSISLRYARQHWNLPKDRKSVWDVDHVMPLKLGGTHALDNLQTLCYLCHKQKTRDDDMPAIAAYKRQKIKEHKRNERRAIRRKR